MIEPNMQLLFELQCYDCGVDRCAATANDSNDDDENCVDKVNCEILYALSSKSFDSTTSTFIVMLKKWLYDNCQLDKYTGKDKDIAGLIVATTATATSTQIHPKNQQVQPIRCQFQSDSNSLYTKIAATHSNNIQMGRNCDFPSTVYHNECCSGSSSGDSTTNIHHSNSSDGAPNTDRHHQFIDCCNQCFPNPIKNGPSDLWGDGKATTIPPRQSKNHNELPCNEQQNYNTKTHRNNLSAAAIDADIEQEQKQEQPCNLFSTKLAGENRTIATATTVTVARCDVHVDGNKPNAKQSNGGHTMSAPSSSSSTLKNASLKPVQHHRSPSLSLSTVIVHRSNRLNIFIKYLLILNCFVCVASGNLMSRNVGNDLSSKHNQTSVDTATTQLNGSASTLIDAVNGGGGVGGGGVSGRRGMLTTASPLLLQSIMSSNRSQFMAPPMPNQKNGRSNSNNHHHLHHQQPATAAAAAVAAAQDVNYDNYGDSGSEEFTRCASCQFREQLKAQNLASIKMHILARLSMTHPPNITGRPHISEQILQSFYQNNDFRYIRIRNGSGAGGSDDYSSAQNEDDDDDDMNEMQGDDPRVTNNKHQHHHHIYNRNGGIKSGLHEQHHHHQSPQYYQNGGHSRHENDFSEDYDGDRGGIVYKMDYFDEPRSSTRFNHYDDMSYDSAEENDEAFYSTTDVIYSFPKLSKARHRGDILEFTIKSTNNLFVSGATFNMFVRGEDWKAENERSSGSSGRSNAGGGMQHTDDMAAGSSTTITTPTNRDVHTSSESLHKLHSKNVNSNHISISINRFIHRHQQQQSTNEQEQSKKAAQPTNQQAQQQQQQQQQRYTRIDSNFVGEIPKGAGEWIQFNITLMVSEWIQQQKHQSVNTQSADIVQEVVIKTLEPWMRQLLVLDTNSKNRPYIEIQTRDMRKHRTKRHLPKDCRENERQSRCCRYPLRVDFRKFGWDWIIAPDIYEAYYCAGECPIGFLPKHPHTYIYSLSSSFSSCCSPRRLSPLSLLYFDDNKNVIHSIIPNMAVEKCGCA
ncbi:uncharacterized protein LOC129574537 [Sitodiplosis mosellana]|uniref:uncharacterized protein LOC129574537 n=1 Tax=Sitodiplosis mosellana TaxID=263140 RepID=UPI0024444D2E|nr:uncharacterized protein LOC129574537 [Sitodiplosis mosellana]